MKAWSPLANRVFLILWLATLFSNIGTWMQNAAAGWLMIELNSSALLVSLVQASTVFPLFLFAFPAGSLADILDKRKLIILVQVLLTITMSILTWLVYYQYITPGLLLLFTFLSGAGAAIIYPSWQAIIPEVVQRDELTKAITLNGISMNLSRAIGPALTGIILVFSGMFCPFLVNSLSNLGIIAALFWWKPIHKKNSKHPAEKFFGSMKLGLRHASANLRLRASIVRGSGFLFFASCYWALMPLVANEQVKSGALFYGLLLGMVGMGAIVGSFLLHDLRSKYNADELVALATVETAIALLLFGATHHPVVGLVASFIAGIAWITILPTLGSLAQLALPDWVRGRGIALYMTIQFGAMSIGSALWGQLSNYVGISHAHYISGFLILFTLLLTKFWPLHRDSLIDITPSKHWRDPNIAVPIQNEDGPVLVTLRYTVCAANRHAFLKDIHFIKRQRLRTGAYFWEIFEDIEKPNIFFETFLVETWLVHLRQHERTIKHDLIVRDRINSYLEVEAEVTHFIARHEHL
ncbi:MAG: MFS transporter [Proteobacteria bacterium]|nr:MFS transporter [Pseudomonadota bacterium]